MENEKMVGQDSNTFIVKVLQEQNRTWQGSITWAEGEKTEYFRSALEMLSLMDEAVASRHITAVEE